MDQERRIKLKAQVCRDLEASAAETGCGPYQNPCIYTVTKRRVHSKRYGDGRGIRFMVALRGELVPLDFYVAELLPRREVALVGSLCVLARKGQSAEQIVERLAKLLYGDPQAIDCVSLDTW